MTEKIELEARAPVFRQAVAAVDRSPLGRLEGYFALFTTVRADCLRHLAGSVVPRPAKI